MKKKKQKSVPRKKIKKSTRKTKSTSTNSPPQGTGLSSASSPSLLKLNQGTKVTLSSFVFFMKKLFVHEKITPFHFLLVIIIFVVKKIPKIIRKLFPQTFVESLLLNIMKS